MQGDEGGAPMTPARLGFLCGAVSLCAMLAAPLPPEQHSRSVVEAAGGQETHPVLPADGRLTTPRTDLPSEAERLHGLRVRKCEKIVEALYPNSGFLPYCETLVATHERMEAEGGPQAAGFGAAWWWSLIYGGANFSLRVGGVAPGSCAGPMDVKHYPLVRDPEENIRWHCREMLGFYKRGVRGRDLCEHVFYPAAPRDWGGGRFRRTERKHRDIIEGSR